MASADDMPQKVEDAEQGGVRSTRGVKRSNKAMVVVIGGQGQEVDDMNKVCWELTSSLQFVELCSIPDHGLRFGVCKTPGGFALTGGEDSTLCSMFDLATKSWKELPPLLHPRYAHGSVFFNGRIFVLSGKKSLMSHLTSVHSLQVDGGQWTEEPDMPIDVDFPEVVCVDNSIFLLNTQTNKLLHFDVKIKTWSKKTSAPSDNREHRGARMVSVHGKLLLAGACGKTFALYTPQTDSWTTGNRPTLEHDFGALVCSHEQKVYLIGGNYNDQVEEYDLDTEAWSVCDVLGTVSLRLFRRKIPPERVISS